MSTELPVKRKAVGDQFRADILAYDFAMKPFILVECKSADVKLNEQAGMQAARYNEQIKAPFIVLSNGLGELGFAIKGDGIEAVSPVSFHLENPQTIRDFNYWHRRGFAGAKTRDAEALISLLNQTYSDEPGQLSYIKAPKMDAYPHVNHYYTSINKWSVAIVSHTDGSTWLCGLHASGAFGNLMLLVCISDSQELPGVIFRQNGRTQIPDEEVSKVRDVLFKKGNRLIDAEPLLNNLAERLL